MTNDDAASAAKINEYMSDILDNIMLIEENALTSGRAARPTINETHIVDHIGRCGEMRMSDISAAMNITTASMTVAADKLVSKGLITRSRDLGDRRVVKLRLTRKGEAVFRLHNRFHMNMLNGIINDMTPDEIAALISSLKKLDLYLKNFNS